MYIAILGRQPALGMAELEHLYGSEHTGWISPQAAFVDAAHVPIERLGGSQKLGRLVNKLPSSDWHQVSTKIIQTYTAKWRQMDQKITLGISAYGFSVSTRDVQQTGILLKQKLKKSGVSLRLIPNTDPALTTATSHHNKLGLADNKVELLVVKASDGKILVAQSTGAQNITAYAKRDQGRPKRDAFVGMLPPKLAQIMINLATVRPDTQDGVSDTKLRILDPFCGTGVILQEAALMGYNVYGTDLSEKMIDYTRANLEWLQHTRRFSVDTTLRSDDATVATWQSPVHAVVTETYLGQPFSAPPSPDKLEQVKRNCDHIIGSFLKNIAPQLSPGTPLAIAVPAWRDTNGRFTHLPLIKRLSDDGFHAHTFRHVTSHDLVYYREDQVVGREILVLTRG